MQITLTKSQRIGLEALQIQARQHEQKIREFLALALVENGGDPKLKWAFDNDTFTLEEPKD